jgi:predicted RNase H-related nuclease YkuK (DUF458 family)
MENFKLFGGQEIKDLSEYLKNYYISNPNIQIFVGTDSAQHGKFTRYATAIAMVNPGKGAHVIFQRFNIKRERDLFTRLWNEVEYTREVADYVHESLKDIYIHKNEKIPIIHLDFNKSPKHKSNKVHDAAMGYLKGYGYIVDSKSDSWAASFVADMLVNN